jgi:hypothetical protein
MVRKAWDFMVERKFILFEFLAVFVLILMLFGCGKVLLIKNQFGETAYPVNWKKDVTCWENIDPVYNLAFSCCCYEDMENREIIDQIHRCGH